jgi:hypothetical protein
MMGHANEREFHLDSIEACSLEPEEVCERRVRTEKNGFQPLLVC